MTPLDDAARDLRAALTDGEPAWIARAERRVDELDHHAPAVPLLAAALWYIERGLHVFPLSPDSKIPLPGSRGFKDATTDARTVRTWWERVPDANIGIATGHQVDVVDVDGLEGQAARCANWGAFEALEVIGTVSTPRPGGMHLYVPASGRGNKAHLFDHVDYRGLGGYVVTAPSRTDQGVYRWLTALDAEALIEGRVA